MEMKLAENIRAFRKERKLTQEQLAEVLGVTTGAVHKWEARLSVPDLELIVEMADFFDTSVDVLLGYDLKDNRLDSTVQRLREYRRKKDPEGLAEAEKALKKYPHSFRIVHECAILYGSGRVNATETAASNDTWDGIQFYCMIEDSVGTSLRSDTAIVSLVEKLAIHTQPQSVTVAKGSEITLSVKASGSGLTYQWYFKKKGQTSFTKWEGRTHASETVTPNDTWDGIQLYCVVKDSVGASVRSDTATVTLK